MDQPAVQIAAGTYTAMLHAGGSVTVWGSNGQVPPLPRPPGLSYAEVASGAAHTVARRSDGSLVAWGYNMFGVCNVPTLPPSLSYVEVAAGETGRQAGADDYMTKPFSPTKILERAREILGSG